MEVAEKDRPVANPSIVLREEFDDRAVLFDLDTGNFFGLNPVGVFVWKLLDGSCKVGDIPQKLRDNFNAVPSSVGIHIRDFIQGLLDLGLAELKDNR